MVIDDEEFMIDFEIVCQFEVGVQVFVIDLELGQCVFLGDNLGLMKLVVEGVFLVLQEEFVVFQVCFVLSDDLDVVVVVLYFFVNVELCVIFGILMSDVDLEVLVWFVCNLLVLVVLEVIIQCKDVVLLIIYDFVCCGQLLVQEVFLLCQDLICENFDIFEFFEQNLGFSMYLVCWIEEYCMYFFECEEELEFEEELEEDDELLFEDDVELQEVIEEVFEEIFVEGEVDECMGLFEGQI